MLLDWFVYRKLGQPARHFRVLSFSTIIRHWCCHFHSSNTWTHNTRRTPFVKTCDMLSTYPLPLFSLFLFVVSLRCCCWVGLCMWMNKWYFVFRVSICGVWGESDEALHGIWYSKVTEKLPTPLKYSLTRFLGGSFKHSKCMGPFVYKLGAHFIF